MAIAFNCPHCLFGYRLPDKLAGKQAKCKNPDCRKVITIPTPITVPDSSTTLDAEAMAAAEAAALSALTDEPDGTKAIPPEEKVIPMTCGHCDHKWNEPWVKAGKNTLCPNPECRQRLRVPEPKEDVPTDWKQARTQLPSLAKQNFEKPTDVQDAGDVKIVSGDSLRKANAIDEGIEPRPLKTKLLLAAGVVGLLGAIVFGVMYLRQSRTETREDQLMVDARTALDETVPAMAPGEAGLCSAVLNLAAMEYALRQNNPKSLKEAHDLFVKAQSDLRKQPPTPERHPIAAELALAALNFGGTDEQTKEEIRFPWFPNTEASRLPRINERPHTVHQELQSVLQLLQPADFDFRAATARKLTRELVKRGQAVLAADLLPLALFTEPEGYEARAMIALEIYRADRDSPLPRKTADELKAAFASGVKGNPYPALAHPLFVQLAIEKAPQVVGNPPASGNLTDSARQAFTALRLLEGKPEEALKLALRPGTNATDSQLKALVLYSEWAADPGPALDAAPAVVAAAPKTRQALASAASNVLQLSLLATKAGKHEQAKTLADALSDEGLKVWAMGEGARLRIAANPDAKADEKWVGAPDSAKDQKAGHAWGGMWVARHNTRLSRSRDAERKAITSWPTAAYPFGLAGIALGLQDP